MVCFSLDKSVIYLVLPKVCVSLNKMGIYVLFSRFVSV